MAATAIGRGDSTVSAWQPRVDGVVEILHAHFTDHAYPMHAHDSWTLLIVDEGAVRYELDRHERGAFGELVTLLPPHIPHNGCATSPRGFRKRVLYLEPDQLPAGLIGASVDDSGFADPQLRRLLSRLHDGLRRPGNERPGNERPGNERPGDELAAESRLALILERLRALLGAPATPDGPGRTPAYRLRDLLEEHVVGGLSLAEAARMLHYHPAHLVRAFSREFGMAPHQYLVSRRVDLARRLILAGAPLPAAAAASGFYDQPHLTRHFRRILGVSPARFPGTGAGGALSRRRGPHPGRRPGR